MQGMGTGGRHPDVTRQQLDSRQLLGGQKSGGKPGGCQVGKYGMYGFEVSSAGRTDDHCAWPKQGGTSTLREAATRTLMSFAHMLCLIFMPCEWNNTPNSLEKKKNKQTCRIDGGLSSNADTWVLYLLLLTLQMWN